MKKRLPGVNNRLKCCDGSIKEASQHGPLTSSVTLARAVSVEKGCGEGEGIRKSNKGGFNRE